MCSNLSRSGELLIVHDSQSACTKEMPGLTALFRAFSSFTAEGELKPLAVSAAWASPSSSRDHNKATDRPREDKIRNQRQIGPAPRTRKNRQPQTPRHPPPQTGLHHSTGSFRPLRRLQLLSAPLSPLHPKHTLLSPRAALINVLCSQPFRRAKKNASTERAPKN